MTSKSLPLNLRLILASLCESVERRIQPNECVFEPAPDGLRYRMKITGGHPGVIAWATGATIAPVPNEPGVGALLISVRADLLAWERYSGLLPNMPGAHFTHARNYSPRVRDAFAELEFALTPPQGGASPARREPMAGFGQVLDILVLVAGKALRPRLDKRTKEYRWLSANGYLAPRESE